MTEKRFIVSIDNKNGVGLYDGDIRLLYFQFNNIQDATECKDALKHQCSLMNELYEENEELKKENKELELQLTVEKLDQHALEHYTKQNEKLQDQINALNTKIAKNEAYIKRIQHKRA